jgi:hypothetical protein
MQAYLSAQGQARKTQTEIPVYQQDYVAEDCE